MWYLTKALLCGDNTSVYLIHCRRLRSGPGRRSCLHHPKQRRLLRRAVQKITSNSTSTFKSSIFKNASTAWRWRWFPCHARRRKALIACTTKCGPYAGRCGSCRTPRAGDARKRSAIWLTRGHRTADSWYVDTYTLHA